MNSLNLWNSFILRDLHQSLKILLKIPQIVAHAIAYHGFILIYNYPPPSPFFVCAPKTDGIWSLSVL